MPTSRPVLTQHGAFVMSGGDAVTQPATDQAATRADLEADITRIRAEQQACEDPERHERLTFMLDSLLDRWARG
jgi:hypothetical protein